MQRNQTSSCEWKGAYKKAQHIQCVCSSNSPRRKNDANGKSEAESEGSTATVVCGRPGRSAGDTGLEGSNIQAWVVGKHRARDAPKPDRQAAQAFGTLIKEMMGLQAHRRGAKRVMQQAMIADGTLVYTSSGLRLVGRKQG